MPAGEKAEVYIRAAGFEPLEPYRRGERWLMRCVKCGTEKALWIQAIRQGSRCTGCTGQHSRRRLSDDEAAAVMRESGFEPLEPYPGSRAPWRCRCTACGSERSPWLFSVRRGTRCACQSAQTSESQAVQELRAAGFEPLEPFRGMTVDWRCKCTRCGSERTLQPRRVREGIVCSACQRAQVAERACEEMRAAGWEPLEPYPGVSGKWRSRCTTCGSESSKTLANVRIGRGCKVCRYLK